MRTDPSALEAAEHPISVVASRTGLSRDVIRIWERRYGAVAPSRSAGHQRLYTDADIRRLRLLAAATRHGRNISLVATLSDEELARLATEDDTAHASVALDSAPSLERVVAAARVPVAALDAPALDGQLRRVIAREGMGWFLDPFVPALMRNIGDAWVAGELSIAEEHLASRVVKALILETVRTAPMPAGAPRVLVATPSGDLHAVGAAMVAATATIEGWAVTYLGVDVPAADIVRAAASCGARIVALSAVYSGDTPRLTAELRAVREQLPASVPLVLGGAAAAAASAGLHSRSTIVCHDLAALRTTLARAATGLPD
jgi:DNA-binding transcriptional MerR regulator/methylmalonyl-CoA mutase cobalamin-binding subunit